VCLADSRTKSRGSQRESQTLSSGVLKLRLEISDKQSLGIRIGISTSRRTMTVEWVIVEGKAFVANCFVGPDSKAEGKWKAMPLQINDSRPKCVPPYHTSDLNWETGEECKRLTVPRDCQHCVPESNSSSILTICNCSYLEDEGKKAFIPSQNNGGIVDWQGVRVGDVAEEVKKIRRSTRRALQPRESFP
jgi:hypothetical protein